MSQHLRRSVSSRVLPVATGLLVLGASMAAWAPGVGAAAQTHTGRALARESATYGAAASRGRVNVRDLARTSKVRRGVHPQPAIRPVRTSPKSPSTAPRTVTVSPPVQVTTTAAPASAIATFDGVISGSRVVRVGGVAANCVVSGENPRAVMVVAAETATGETFCDLLALRKSYCIFTVYLVDTAAADAVMGMIL